MTFKRHTRSHFSFPYDSLNGNVFDIENVTHNTYFFFFSIHLNAPDKFLSFGSSRLTILGKRLIGEIGQNSTISTVSPSKFRIKIFPLRK